MAVIQPRHTHILYQCAKCGDDRTSFVTCATFNMYQFNGVSQKLA